MIEREITADQLQIGDVIIIRSNFLQKGTQVTVTKIVLGENSIHIGHTPAKFGGLDIVARLLKVTEKVLLVDRMQSTKTDQT